MCLGNVRLFHRSPLEGMFPRAGSSLLLLMSLSLDIPICKVQNAQRVCYGRTYEELKNFKLQKGKHSLRPRGRLGCLSHSERWFTCERRISARGVVVNPKRGGQNKGGIHANPLIIIAPRRGSCHFAMSNRLPHAPGVYLKGASLLFEL